MSSATALLASAMTSAEIVDAQFRAFNDALQCTDGNGFAAVICDDYLATVRMSPFLMTALLSHFHKAVAPQYANDIVRVANGKALAHLDRDFDELG